MSDTQSPNGTAVPRPPSSVPSPPPFMTSPDPAPLVTAARQNLNEGLSIMKEGALFAGGLLVAGYGVEAQRELTALGLHTAVSSRAGQWLLGTWVGKTWFGNWLQRRQFRKFVRGLPWRSIELALTAGGAVMADKIPGMPKGASNVLKKLATAGVAIQSAQILSEVMTPKMRQLLNTVHRLNLVHEGDTNGSATSGT